jgi:hypothetical protein
MRFDVRLGHIAPMIAAGEANVADLGDKIRDAIIKVVDKETEWRVSGTETRPAEGMLRYDEIEYDFS